MYHLNFPNDVTREMQRNIKFLYSSELKSVVLEILSNKLLTDVNRKNKQYFFVMHTPKIIKKEIPSHV